MSAAEEHILERLEDPKLTDGQRSLFHLQLNMIHNPPTCDVCKGQGSLSMVKDFRGNCFAIVCKKCQVNVNKMLDKLFRKYGGYIDHRGIVQASCLHSPTIQSIEHLQQETA